MINDRVELLILRNLIQNEEYSRKVLPFLKKEYFSEESEKIIFDKISSFVSKFNNLPTREAILIDCSQDNKIPNGIDSKISQIIEELGNKYDQSDQNWLITETEKFCQDKAIFNAVLESVGILKEEKNKKGKGAIPKLLQDALSVSFDPHIGHSYTEDFDYRYEFYHKIEEKIPFDIRYLNKITNGGITNKTLNIFMGGINCGKSLTLCHLSGSYLIQGKNVLYITLEMSEEKIAERIDANLLDVELDNLKRLSKDIYISKIENVRQKTLGKLIIKEYPTASAGCNHFRALLQELNLKKSFIPDVIVVDYLNLATSTRVTQNNTNSYNYIKNVAEELRGLAVEFDVPIISATQYNRQGFQSSDVGLEDTSESFGLPMTADLVLALICTEELDKMGRILIKQLKNRYNDVNYVKRFIVGVSRSKMRLFDVDDHEQKKIIEGPSEEAKQDDDKSVFDQTPFGEGMQAESRGYDDFKF